jgi:hypothetical protein
MPLSSVTAFRRLLAFNHTHTTANEGVLYRRILIVQDDSKAREVHQQQATGMRVDTAVVVETNKNTTNLRNQQP